MQIIFIIKSSRHSIITYKSRKSMQ